MLDKQLTTLCKIEDLIEILEVDRPFTDKRLNDIILWYLGVASERIENYGLLGASKINKKLASEKRKLNNIGFYWRELHNDRMNYIFEHGDSIVLGLIDNFLYYLIKELNNGWNMF